MTNKDETTTLEGVGSTGVLGCPFCGAQPEINSSGTFIEIACCCSMMMQKSDHLSLNERADFNKETFRYSDASERYVMRLAIEMWNTRKQPNNRR